MKRGIAFFLFLLLSGSVLAAKHESEELYSQGWQLFTAKNYPAAAEAWRKSAETGKGRWPAAAARMELVALAMKQGQFGDAEALLNEIFALQPLQEAHRQQAIFKLLELYRVQGKNAEAREVIAEERARRKEDIRYLVMLDIREGEILLSEGRYKEAMPLFRRAALDRANQSLAWNGAARCAYMQKDYAQAKACLKESPYPDKDLLKELNDMENPFAVPPEKTAKKLHSRFQSIREKKMLGAFGGFDSTYRTPDEPKLQDGEPYDASRYSFAYYKMLSEGGFDTAFQLFGPWKNGFGELNRMEAALRFAAEGAARYGINLMPVLQYSIQVKQHRHFYSGQGKDSSGHVCPADWSYWEDEMLSRCLIAAKVGKDFPNVIGAVLDFEMYVKDGSRYPGPCLCDSCFREFFEAVKNTRPEPARENRLAWIKENGLFDSCLAWTEWKMAQTCTRLEKAVHADYPEFVFAYCPFFEWFPGCTRGLGTPEQPVLVLSEMEYSTGYSAAVKDRSERMEKNGYPGFYMPGVWLLKIPAEAFAGHMYSLAEDSDGAWIYTSASFWNEKYDPKFNKSKFFYGDSTGEVYRAAAMKTRLALDAKAKDPSFKPPFSLPSVIKLETPVLPLDELPAGMEAKIDGEGNEAFWKALPVQTMRNNRTGEKIPGSIEFRIAFDKKNLYLLAEIPEPDMAQLKKKVEQDDDFKIFSDDIVEVFLGFDRGVKVAHWGINANGKAAQHMVFVAGEDRSWRGHPEIAVKLHEKSWTLEAAFPWKYLTEKNETGLLFNLAASRADGQKIWSPTFGLFMNPDRFGKLVLNWKK